MLPSIPNVTYDESFTIGNSFVSVRGVAQINNADSPIAIVVDGVPQNSQKQLRMELFDIERIEVLKGPQGALYGRNAIGGALNIVTQRPTNELKGWVEAGYGSGDTTSVAGAISGPIAPDKALFRVSAAYKDSDGQIDNEFLDEEVDFYTSKDVRGRMIFMPTDALEIDVRASWSNLDGGAVMDASMRRAIRQREPRSRAAFRHPRQQRARDHRRHRQARLAHRLRHADVDHGLYGPHRGLLRRPRLLQSRRLPGRDLRLGPQADQAQHLDVELLSQELRFASPDDRDLRWIVGAFYINTKRDLETIGNFLFPGVPPIHVPGQQRIERQRRVLRVRAGRLRLHRPHHARRVAALRQGRARADRREQRGRARHLVRRGAAARCAVTQVHG